jgi:threonylcarbamoyladenosine tRNA methylthiotransferase MtaB
MKRFTIITLGCKVNRAESDAISEGLSGPDWQPVARPEEADLCVINTCTVTQKAATQSRQAVRQVIHANPGACVVATGCYAATDPEALARIKGLDYIVGSDGKQRLPEMMRCVDARKCTCPASSSAGASTPHQPQAEAGAPASGRTRPFLKIQDGCDAFCAYCIVPYARGTSRSVAFQSVLEALARLASLGFKEAVLTGIHLGCYGKDLEPPSGLIELMKAVEALDIPLRVRLSSIEPLELSEDIIALVAGSRRFCRHFHIPLQSGDAGVLKRMGRPYTPEDFAQRAASVRRLMPDAAIGADVMAGFPGETNAAFENTCRLIEELPLSYLHVFPFSARPGTAAWDFPDKVPAGIIKERCRRLRRLGSLKRLDFHRGFIGRTVEVLVEQRRDPKNGLLKGISSNYLPVLFEGDDRAMNRLVRVVVNRADAARLWAVKTVASKAMAE